MTQTNVDPQPVSAQLDAIQSQLTQVSAQLAAVTAQLGELPQLSARVAQIENALVMVSDIQRFERLQQHLEAGNWYEADRETTRAIVEIAGQDDIEDLSPNDIRRFPCTDLQVIDGLWTRYSQGKFGFSVQARLYGEVGGTSDTAAAQNVDMVERWGDRLGWRDGDRWRKCSELDYSLNAPKGCHPSLWWNSPYGSKMTNYFLVRLLSCHL